MKYYFACLGKKSQVAWGQKLSFLSPYSPTARSVLDLQKVLSRHQMIEALGTGSDLSRRQSWDLNSILTLFVRGVYENYDTDNVHEHMCVYSLKTKWKCSFASPCLRNRTLWNFEGTVHTGSCTIKLPFSTGVAFWTLPLLSILTWCLCFLSSYADAPNQYCGMTFNYCA